MSNKIVPERQDNLDSSRKGKGGLRSGRRTWIALAVVGSVLFLLGLAVLGFLFSTPAPDLSTISQGIAVFDRLDQPIALLRSDRTLLPVRLANISPFLRMALVVAEDKNFYSHHGVDPFGIIRALMADAESHRMIQGGSTITQQLVKNLYFDGRKRTLSVKLREAFMAIQIDERYSKEQILEAYLNNVYFGSGTYGAEEASERYFGKSAENLSLAEAAYLSGLVNAPSVLSANRKEAVARAHAILDNMSRFGMITTTECDTAKNTKLEIKSLPTPSDKCSYYLIEVRRQLEERFDPNRLYHQGVRAYTNLDLIAQELASSNLSKDIKHAPAGVSQGALVSISVSDGSVIAMVGGAGSFQKSPWNRALSPHTAGSAFKPFVYLSWAVSRNSEARYDD